MFTRVTSERITPPSGGGGGFCAARDAQYDVRPPAVKASNETAKYFIEVDFILSAQAERVQQSCQLGGERAFDANDFAS